LPKCDLVEAEMKKYLKVTTAFESPLRDGRKREIFHAALIPVGTRLDLEEKVCVLRYGKDLTVDVLRKIITVNPKSMGIHDKYSCVTFDTHKPADIETKEVVATAPKSESRESEFLKKLLENSEEVAPDVSDWLREHSLWDEWGVLERLLEKGKVSREDVLEVQRELEKESRDRGD
jgi:hypothetical protein